MTKPSPRYYLTNQQNLGYSLARGMITDASGYGDKYYADLLQRYPGWLPLFRRLSADLIEQVTRDGRNLHPVALQIDPARLTGDAWAVTAAQPPGPLELPQALTDDIEMLLLPLPLPINLFDKFWFADRNVRDDVLDRWETLYSNTPIPEKRRLGSKKNLFTGKKTISLLDNAPPEIPDLPEAGSCSLAQPDTAGALRALLFHFAHRWPLACDYYEWLFLDGEQPDINGCTSSCSLTPSPSRGEGRERVKQPARTCATINNLDPVLRQARRWLQGESHDAGESEQIRLFWSIVDRLPESEFNPIDLVITTLEGQQNAMPEKFRQRLDELAITLRGIRGVGGKTTDELFAENKKPLARALVLFFLLDDSAHLIQYNHPELNHEDYLYASILFAAREGWLRLPKTLRHSPRFIDETNAFMASLAQRNKRLRIEWPEHDEPEQPLYRQLARADNAAAERRAREKRKKLAQLMGWNCIETRILLAPGDYPLNVSARGVEIRFAGEPKSIDVQVNSDCFFEKLDRQPLPPDILARMK